MALEQLMQMNLQNVVPILSLTTHPKRSGTHYLPKIKTLHLADSSCLQTVDRLIEELKILGANAIPNYDDISEGEKIIDTAVSNYGTVHVLVSNMGTVKHNNFTLMSNEEWLSMLTVDLKGSYKVYSITNSKI